MRIITKLTILFSFLLAFSIIFGETIIADNVNINLPYENNQFEHATLGPNKFQMNHGFSIMTSNNQGTSKTSSVYSNFSSYKLSEKMLFKTGLHLIQNQNYQSHATGNQNGLGYEFGLEYKLSPNSLISLHIMNYNNSPLSLGNHSPFYVP